MNRVYPPAAEGHTGLLYDDLSWLQPDLNQLPELSRYNDLSVSWRLYQITELSEGKAAGRRLAMEKVVDKRFEDIQGHLNDTVIKRLRIGQGKGMYNTSVYVGANKASVYERLAQGVLSIFQGNQASMTPLRVHKLNQSGALQLSSLFTGHPLPQNEVSSSQALMHSIPLCQPEGLLAATRLTADELVLKRVGHP